LFFGWEPYNIVPIISLELADFGTLKDTLVSEFELSWLQKCNIAVDVVVGLYALHECGFIHGDIKPSNIMLQSHQHRQIVAKLMDFSGSANMANFGTMRHHRFLTKLWAAPENLGLIPVIDNKEAADVYALGLLLAQMWPKEEFKFLELESFLEHEIPRNLHGRQKETMLLYYKALP
jgi:serine/threonine protein kinase